MSSQNDAVVATFGEHAEAEAAIRKLSDAGLNMKQFSIIGKGYHTEEQVVGFYNAGDRMQFWGKNGAIWGGLWGLLFGGMMITVPVLGPVMVLGHLAGVIFAAFEGAAIVGGLGVLGAALFSIGLPENSVIAYEEALKADGFLVVGNGPTADMARAKTVLDGTTPTKVDLHHDVTPPAARTEDHAGHHHPA